MSAIANELDQDTQHAIAQGKTFCWHQIHAPNDQTSVDFYTKAFGWGTTEMTVEGMPPYRMLVANGMPVAGVIGTSMCPEGANIAPHWSVSIYVDDVDATAAQCKNLGGKVLAEPMDIPSVGRIALIEDPQGASFWIFQPQGR